MAMPPRGKKSPCTSSQRGCSSANRSAAMRFTTSSLNVPWLRKLNKYNFKDFDSTR